MMAWQALHVALEESQAIILKLVTSLQLLLDEARAPR